MGQSMSDVFINESESLTQFCVVNDVLQFHSGGGNFHYSLESSNEVLWLFNLADYEGIPTQLDDICVGGLFLDDLIDNYGEDRVADIEKHIIDKAISGVSVDNGSVLIKDKPFKEVISIAKSINLELALFKPSTSK